MVEHIDAARLSAQLPETAALLAIREKCEATAEELSFAFLMEAARARTSFLRGIKL